MMLTNKEITKWLQSLKSEIGKQNNRHLWNFEEALDMAIKELSTEATEVVRCKDCKFYTDAGTIPNKSCCGFCTKLGAVSYYGVDATDYCSFGEREDGEA